MLRSLVVVAALVAMAPSSFAQGDSPTAKHEAAVRARGRFFSKVAVDRDYSGEWVIARTKKTTAFLDIADPRHPRTRASGQASAAIHILVVPNQAREHIAARLGDPIGEDDLKAALAVFSDARTLAKRLGIKNAKVYANSESRIGVGYFHVHIEGDLPNSKKLPKLEK